MKLTDLKIGTQLKIGFGIIVLLILMLSTISWKMNNRLAQQTTELYDHPLQVRRALGELNLDIMGMRLEYRNYLIAGNDQERQTAFVSSQVYQEHAERQFSVLYDRYLGPKTDIDIAHDAFIRWVAVRAGNRDLAQQGKISEAMSRIEANGDVGKERENLLNSIKVIDDFARNKGDQFQVNSIVLKNRLNRILGYLSTCILALSILIVYLLNKNIRRPIKELTTVAQNFTDGKLDARSKYVSLNEYGLLSVAFNNLADTIETELILNKKSAKLSGVMLIEDDAHRFCHTLLTSLLEHTESQMAAMYLLNDGKTDFNLFECIGMNSEDCNSFSAVNFEGEFGIALATKKMQHITNIPENSHFTFTTVSGKFTPREIITIPIVIGNETVAIISLATIKNFSKISLRLINTILNTLNARMGGILAYRKVIHFSRQLETQNKELEAQKRELSAQTSELSEQNVELEMQKKQLDEANKLKTSFLSNMSHELRTPLNSVIALSGVLNRRLAGKIADEEYSFIDVIERNGKQLLLLINDILDLSRIESGREELVMNRFNVNELIREVVELIEPQSQQKNIKLYYQPQDNIPALKTDYEKSRHILQNLVANAVKFTETGEVKVSVKATDDFIHISVADTGIGIAQAHLSHIFDEFRQADGSNSRKYGGTGLGLAIAKKYAELLGGSIDVESILGKGSKFTVNLPIRFISSLENAEITQLNHRETSNSYTQNIDNKPTNEKTILLVEDTEAIIIQMKDMLELQGYNIMVARNGNEALVQIAKKIPDGMILDLMMPEVDGFEVLKRIREHERTERLPVIILTAKYVTKDELAFLKHNNVYQLIQKGDINKDQLLGAIAGSMFAEKEEAHRIEKPVSQPISGIPLVLIVEDNPDNMLTIKALLDGKCTIIEAETGHSGVEMAIEHRPHLILMDIALPGMNGIEALNIIRKNESLQHIPIVAVSASAMKGDKEDFISLGFDAYIPKPINYIQFEKTINEFLN